LVFSPFIIYYIYSPMNFIRNTLLVLVGRLTWVSISLDRKKDVVQGDFPKGVLSPFDGFIRKNASKSLIERMNIMYAKDYKIVNDIVIVIRGFRSLGRRL